ncbi:MAG: tRNA (N(6)-L-threonylcarbamoyladenosine(37)-C(2))-methylthiotransferase MtaB [Nitrospirota bacterium]
MRVAVVTLGCKVNQSESSSIEGMLKDESFEIVGYADNPDVCIVNTCSVTSKSDYQSRQLIRKALKSGAKVIATGCYAQLNPGELSKIEGLSLIIGNSEKDKIVNYLKTLPLVQKSNPLSIINASDNTLSSHPYYSTRSRAFLKIQDGCNFSCTYCTVPKARGKSRSLNPPDVLLSANMLSAEGYKEIVLTGIHIGSYGLDLQHRCSLLDIVKMLIDAFPDIRFRLSSIEPQEYKEDFLLMIKAGSVCDHLHIPLQSGSDNVLKEMNRGYTTSFYKSIIERIFFACPDISIGTDIITGFPGESDDDFNETVKFLENLPLSYFHVFPYSKRPNTKAGQSKNQLTEKAKHERMNMLLELSNQKKKLYLRKNLGRVVDVIVENQTTERGLYKAISGNYIKLLIKSSNALERRQRLKVKVISLTDSGLIAEPLNK